MEQRLDSNILHIYLYFYLSFPPFFFNFTNIPSSVAKTLLYLLAGNLCYACIIYKCTETHLTGIKHMIFTEPVRVNATVSQTNLLRRLQVMTMLRDIPATPERDWGLVSSTHDWRKVSSIKGSVSLWNEADKNKPSSILIILFQKKFHNSSYFVKSPETEVWWWHENIYFNLWKSTFLFPISQLQWKNLKRNIRQAQNQRNIKKLPKHFGGVGFFCFVVGSGVGWGVFCCF